MSMPARPRWLLTCLSIVIILLKAFAPECHSYDFFTEVEFHQLAKKRNSEPRSVSVSLRFDQNPQSAGFSAPWVQPAGADDLHIIGRDKQTKREK